MNNIIWIIIGGVCICIIAFLIIIFINCKYKKKNSRFLDRSQNIEMKSIYKKIKKNKKK